MSNVENRVIGRLGHWIIEKPVDEEINEIVQRKVVLRIASQWYSNFRGPAG